MWGVKVPTGRLVLCVKVIIRRRVPALCQAGGERSMPRRRLAGAQGWQVFVVMGFPEATRRLAGWR